MVFAVTTNNGVDSANIVALGLRPPPVNSAPGAQSARADGPH